MTKLTIEVNFDDLISDMFCDAEGDEYGVSPTGDFKDYLKADISSQISSQIIKSIKSDVNQQIARDAGDQITEFVSGELRGIITRKLRAGEIRSGYGGFKSYDELIEKQLSSRSVENAIERHIDSKAKAFANDMKTRYDNIFAAKIVGALKEQKMLSPEVASLLLGGNND